MGSASESAGISLHEAQSGARLRVLRVEVSEENLEARLESHGFWPGTELSVVRRAPFGDPIQVKLRGLHLALRRDEARLVRVEEVPG